MQNQPPPPYQDPYQAPKSGPNILVIVLAIIAVLGCGGVVIMAAILFPVFNQAKVAAKKTLALSNAKRCAIAAIMYSTDYDDRLPPADKWMDLTLQYAKDEAVFVSPAARDSDPQAYGFAFRKALSKKQSAKIEDPQDWATVFDSTILTRNANSDLETLPNPPRYGSGSTASNMIAFADGHAKATPSGGLAYVK